MAKILVILDERSFFWTELSGPAGETVQTINSGSLPDDLAIPPAYRQDGHFCAFQNGEMVIVIWKGQPGQIVSILRSDLPKGRTQSDLNLREKQVLQLLTEGRSIKQIADRLRLTTRTIRFYINSLNHKLGTHSAEQSVGKGVILGLCQMPAPPNDDG